MEGSRWRSWRILLTPYYLNLYARQAHVLRVAAAFLVGLGLNLLFEIPHGSWMLVTILIVLGSVPHWGGVRRKALQRMGGSLLGAAAGLVAMALYRHSPLSCYAWMTALVMLSAWFALGKGEYLALLVGLTMVIVAGLGNEPLEAALWRSFNVLAGSVLGLVAAGLFPLRAIDSWRFLLADNLREAATLYSKIARRREVDAGLALERFNSRLIRMRALVAAAVQESGLSGGRFDAIQRRQRALCSLLDRMSEVAQDTPALTDGAESRRAIVRTLMRAAHGMRFSQPGMLAETLEEAVSPLALDKPSYCHWLTAEFNLVAEHLREDLALLLPSLMQVPPPSRGVLLMVWRWLSSASQGRDR
ncbi:FUSC family protein [Chromobacterium haemolyticum]|uniref:FUSC family protein n=1 Tax=Chromobacterium haemolyticum TaxID=394935 RepID=UPI00244D6C1F|nr:FUSC family protein [Chromobacterium haemolyticum]MDH0341146.1 FUSC family protein [Chromobacterium haemolyticum]